MKLFLLGGTGRTGTEFLDLALSRGHELTAFVRSPAKISRQHPRLYVVRGDPRSTDELTLALPGHDAVVSAIGPRPREALRGTRLLGECASSTVRAMTAVGVRRLAIVSSALLFPEKGAFFTFFRWLLRHHVADLRDMERVVVESTLSFTIVRPPRLVHSRAEHYRAAKSALPGRSAMSFRAVAVAMLDALERPTEPREVIGLTRGSSAHASTRELIRTSA